MLLLAVKRPMKRKPVTTFALIATILLTLTASVASVTAAPTVVPAVAPATQSVSKMYVVIQGSNKISQANLDGTGVVDLGNLNATLNSPSAIALDVVAGKMYVANRLGDTISQANLDGSGGVDLGNLGGTLDGPTAIALDVVAGKMYVANRVGDTISQANLDGSGGVDLGNLGGTLDESIGIALDVAAGKMYVVNYDSETVSRANLDGTGGEDLGNLNGTLDNPTNIALDVAAGKMYVANFNANSRISQANLDGTGGVDLGNLNATLNQAVDIALDVAAGKMYVANRNGNTISQANLDGTGGVDLGNLGGTLNKPRGIALDVPAVTTTTTTTTTIDNCSDANLDTSDSPTKLTGGAAYDLNCTYGHICADSACNGGNHFQADVQVFAKDGQICVIPPSGYEVVGDTCKDAGGRKDFVIQHIGGTNGAANGAAVVADEPAAAAEAVSGYAMGASGGTFSCPVTSGNVNVTVPANVVADGTRFLCAASENSQSAAAPIGYSLVCSRVDLTTDTGLATFDSALTVCLSHTVADILKAGGAAANLRVGFFDGVMWQPLPLTSSSANETCGLTDHLTQFGLMAATPTALPAMGTSVAPIVVSAK